MREWNIVWIFSFCSFLHSSVPRPSRDQTVDFRISCCVGRAYLYNIFQMKPTRCTLLLGIFISTYLHVSANYVPIISRTYCIYATLVFFTLYGWLSGPHYFLVYLFQLIYMFRPTMCPLSEELTVSMRHWYFSLCMGDCLVYCSKPNSHLYRKIPMSHRYSKFSWWWAHRCPKHVEKLK